MVRDTMEPQAKTESQVTVASQESQVNQERKETQASPVTQVHQERRERGATQASRDPQVNQDLRGHQARTARQDTMASRGLKEIQATQARTDSQVTQERREIQVHLGNQDTANQDLRETQASQVTQGILVNQEMMELMEMMELTDSQVNQALQVLQARMGSTATQARTTTHRPPSRSPSRPQRCLTPQGAAGAGTDSASTGLLTAAATAPTRNSNHRTLLKTQCKPLVNQQDLNVLSTTNTFL